MQKRNFENKNTQSCGMLQNKRCKAQPLDFAVIR